MNDGYNKLFASIVTSTVWQECSDTRVVWTTLLALANKHGEVMGSIPGLANVANVSIEAFERALATFESPDKYSRTTDNEGRRLERIDGGFRLLNHSKYRAILSQESIRASKAAYMRQQRAKAKEEPDSTVEQSGKSGQPKQRQRQKQKQEASPCSPPPGDGTAAAPPVPRETSAERNARKVTFEQFMASLDGKPALPKTAPIHAYCRDAGIPPSMLLLAWHVFRQYHLNRPDKKQLDWRKVFDNYVRENYLKLWRTTPDGGYELTDKGEQANRALYASQGGA